MRISLFLPHVGVFGGVRRYLELGNAWVAMGHSVALFHPTGDPPRWLPFTGLVIPTERSATLASDVAICGDPGSFDAFRSHRARIHLYYCVLERDAGVRRALADPAVQLAANSSALRRQIRRRTRRPVLDGIGGINLDQFQPQPARRAHHPLRVLINGRRSRPKKGTDLILAALRSLRDVPEFEVVLFDTVADAAPDPRDGARLPARARFVLGPTQAELAELYRSAHVFVAAERKAGWCNTALEALASGCAVVCTRSGTGDFARHGENALVVRWRHPFFIARAVRRLLTNAPLRERLAARGPAAAADWSWDRLARKLAVQFEGNPITTGAG